MPPKIDKRSDPEYIEMINFLIEKTRDAKSSLIIKQLAEEFKEKSGSSQQVDCWRLRIGTFRLKIHEMDSINTEQKVKMIFGLSVPIDLNYLNELQNYAHVEVDGKYRIVKYRANDGSLELEGDHSKSTKAKAELCRRQNTIDENLDDSELHQPNQQRQLGSEKSHNDSDDESQESIPKTPKSVKRSATEMPNSFKRAKDSSPARPMKSENPAPNDLSRLSESRVRVLVRGFSPQPPNLKVQKLRQPEGEGALRAPETRTHQDSPIFKNGTAPRAPAASIPQNPIKTVSGADGAYTPQVKFLEAIQSLVLNLDMPSLFPLQAKIEKKIRESSSNERIANDEIILAIEVLVTKVANRSVLNLSETVESISLKEFLCYLKAAILNSKLESLENLLEKIKKRIKEPTSNDKNIPAEKVASALQYTLDGISF